MRLAGLVWRRACVDRRRAREPAQHSCDISHQRYTGTALTSHHLPGAEEDESFTADVAGECSLRLAGNHPRARSGVQSREEPPQAIREVLAYRVREWTCDRATTLASNASLETL
jgi:hypothetical protein